MDKWLNHPTTLKIISVLLATLLWAVVHLDPESPATVSSLIETQVIEAVRVGVEGLEEDRFDLRAIEPSVVTLKVRGNRSDLLSSSASDYLVTVDLTGKEAGEHTVAVQAVMPRRIELMEISPAQVTVQLEPMVTETFAVQVVTTGTPAFDYRTGRNVQLSVEEAAVTLPADLMEQVGMVGAVVSVDGAENNVNQSGARLIVYNRDGAELTGAVVEPTTVDVQVPIIKPSKALPLRLGLTGELPRNLSLVSLTPAVSEVRIYGPQEVLNGYELYEEARINLNEVRQSGTVSIELPPPEGVAEVAPATLDVEIIVEATEQRTISQVPVRLSGLALELNVEFVNPATGLLSVGVEGAPRLVSALGVSDIRLSASVSGLGPGTHQVPVAVELPDLISLVSEDELTVTVDLIPIDPLAFGPTEPEPGGEGEPEGNSEQNGSGGAVEGGSPPPVGSGNGSGVPEEEAEPDEDVRPEEEAEPDEGAGSDEGAEPDEGAGSGGEAESGKNAEPGEGTGSGEGTGPEEEAEAEAAGGAGLEEGSGIDEEAWPDERARV